MAGYTAKGRLALSLLALGALGAALAGCGGGGASTAPLTTGGDTKGVISIGEGRGIYQTGRGVYQTGKSGDSAERDKPVTRGIYHTD